MTNLFMPDLFITNTKNHPCISPPPIYKPPPPCISPPLYKPIKNRLRKCISPGLIVGGLWYIFVQVHLLSVQLKCSSNIDSIHYLGLTNSFHQVPRNIHTLPSIIVNFLLNSLNAPITFVVCMCNKPIINRKEVTRNYQILGIGSFTGSV